MSVTGQTNSQKRSPKTPIKYAIPLNEEKKKAKARLLPASVGYIKGKAGTGKTMLSSHIALNLYQTRQIDRIVITRPTVRAIDTSDLGALPGNLDDKSLPWIDPIIDNMYKITGKKVEVDKMLQEGAIVVKPIQFMRGITISNEILLVDECQNITESQLKLILTRLGKGSKILLTGDIDQCDFKKGTQSGITKLEYLSTVLPDQIAVVELQENHRNELVTAILDNW